MAHLYQKTKNGKQVENIWYDWISDSLRKIQLIHFTTRSHSV